MALMTPRPHQLTGAQFLSQRTHALLADQQRVGKTGATIIAADQILAKSIIVVTTASGRAVWKKAFNTWSDIPRTVEIYKGGPVKADVVIMSWAIAHKYVVTEAYDLLILDEAHYAKSPDAKRTQAVFGKMVNFGAGMLYRHSLSGLAQRIWCLTGTPAPHDPGDLWPMLRACAPDRLKAINGLPDVTRYDDFRNRYCVIKPKRISQWRTIPVVIGGRNMDELRSRIAPFMLRRTQKDIGILPPSFETLPLLVDDKLRRESDGDCDRAAVLEAAENGDTAELELHLGKLRRITGMIKAGAVIDALEDEFVSGLQKIVLMFWHTDVGQELLHGLRKYKPVLVDGSTSPKDREAAIEAFHAYPSTRVFIGQIAACGEAIDLSAAADLWFVESCFTPAMMSQASSRVVNVNKDRNCFVKVVTLEGSIDEAIQGALMRLWTAIRQVIQ